MEKFVRLTVTLVVAESEINQVEDALNEHIAPLDVLESYSIEDEYVDDEE